MTSYFGTKIAYIMQKRLRLLGHSPMKRKNSTYLPLVAVLMSPMAANAELLTFEYNFLDGDVLAGILDGNIQADGDTVWIEGFMDVTFNGVAMNSIEAGDIRSSSDFPVGALQSLVSFSGSVMDVFVCSLGFTSGNCFFIDDGGFYFDTSFIGEEVAAGLPSETNFQASFIADDWTLEATSVPEPGTLALFGLGLAGMGMSRRRRKV